jgi:acetyl esterase/lipase
MKRLTCLGLVAGMLGLLMLSQPAARAGSISVDALLADPALDETTAQGIALTGSFDQSSYDQCPIYPTSAFAPTVANVLFKTPPNGASLYANIYIPPATFGTSFSAIVLAHGGGWWRGCRTTNAEEAAHLAGTDYGGSTYYDLPHHYIVVAIDYRLSCDSADPDLVAPPSCPCAAGTTTPPPTPG